MARRSRRNVRPATDDFQCLARAPTVVSYAVELYISSAYWFTASTSFANPAVTVARSLDGHVCWGCANGRSNVCGRSIRWHVGSVADHPMALAISIPLRPVRETTRVQRQLKLRSNAVGMAGFAGCSAYY
jgi:hypothetical protein